MQLIFGKNKKYIMSGVFLLVCVIAIFSRFFVKANNGWITENLDGYYNIGNNIELKIDIVDTEKNSINDSSSMFYNGEKVYIKFDWRAIEDVNKITSFSLQLPTSKDISKIGFEEPIATEKNIVSDDEMIATVLSKNGSLIKSFFNASEDNIIKKGTKGMVLVPHSIFINYNGAKVAPQNMKMLLTSNDGDQKLIEKQVNKVAQGLYADNFQILDKNTSQPITQLDSLKTNVVLFSFDYHSGNYGIRNGDSLLFKFEPYTDGNKTGKIMPFAYESINVKDGTGNIVGTLSFINELADTGNTFMKLVFNDSFKNAKIVDGNIKVLVDISFNDIIKDSSVVTFKVNNEERTLNIKGPTTTEKKFENRFDLMIKDLNVIRKNIAINEEDILNKADSTVIDNYILQENVKYDNYYIDKDSIRILKILAKDTTSKDTITSYSFDIGTLKPASISGNDRIGEEIGLFNGHRGLTVNEFKSYISKNSVISFTETSNGSVTGFTLDLGKLNEPKGTNGEYQVMNSKGETSTVLKDNKVFGYLVYYNILSADKSASIQESKKGNLKIQVVDGEKIPVANVKMLLTNDKGFSQTAVTNTDGFIEFNSLKEGNYELKENELTNSSIKPIKFSVTDKNISNLDLTLEKDNKSRTDLSFENKIYSTGIGKTAESYVNVVSSEHKKGRIKVIIKDEFSKEPIPDAEFVIFDKEGYRIDGDTGVIKVQLNGEGVSGFLPTGEYYFTQSKSSNGYILDKEKHSVTIAQADEVKEFEIFNKGEAIIDIINISDSDKPIANSSFSIYAYNDLKNPVALLNTNDVGQAITEKIPFGRYYLKQTDVDKTYERNNINIPIIVSHDKISKEGVYRVEVINKPFVDKMPKIPEEEEQPVELVDETPLGAPEIERPVVVNSDINKQNPVTADGLKIYPYLIASVIIVILVVLRRHFVNKIKTKPAYPKYDEFFK